MSLRFALRHGWPGFALEAEAEVPLQGVTAVFGPSGGGKTTLLRALAGLEPGVQGRIEFGDQVWLGGPRGPVPPHKRRVGYVFQDARLFDHLTVEGNLAYAARRSGALGTPLWGETLDALDLAPMLARRPVSLSGGERQRVAIGRALLSRPQVLMMDEPLSALDRKRKAAILPHLQEVSARFRIPTLYVSHALDEVVQLADRVLLLDRGRVAALGGVAEVLERPEFQSLAGRFEAGSVVDAEVLGHDEAVRLTRLTLCGQPLSMPMLGGLAPGTKVRLRIRARDVALATERPRGISIRNVLAGHVAALETEADTAFAEVLVDLGGARLRARITREAATDLALAPGGAVFALIKSVAFDRRGIMPPDK
ncbi:MAG: molybdate transport system ATP-binding protein [Paracoccaceae bacterium]|jgi:molybdate transport system ATP-binding protein